MRRILLPGLLMFLLALVAGSPAYSEKLHAVSSDSTETSTDSILRFWLKTQGVDDEKPFGNTFYFWTTAEELAASQKENTLLRRFDAGTLLLNLYRKNINDPCRDNHPLAKLLRGSDYSRVQDAWPCYWPALAENYEYRGDQLVKVVLEDSALVIVFHPDRTENAWQVFDMKGTPVSLPEALEAQSRIALVYFESEKKVQVNIPVNQVDLMPGEKHSRKMKISGYRSFILCNERMIKSWHHAVPGMQNQVNKDLSYLLLLHAWFGSNSSHMLQPGKNGKNAQAAWKSEEALSPAQACMQTYRYSTIAADTAATKSIVDELRRCWPLQKNPIEKFPSRGIR